MENQDSIISFLRKQNILNDRQIQQVVEKHNGTGKSLISILKNDELISEDQLTILTAVANKIEFINLSPEMIDSSLAHLLPYKIVSRYNVIPLRKDGDKLVVVMSSPLNLPIRDKIEVITGNTVIPVAAMPSAIRQAIHYHFNVKDSLNQNQPTVQKQDSDDKSSNESDQLLEKTISGTNREKDSTEDAVPVKDLVSSIIRGAIDAQASDIHVEPQDVYVKVRYRVDGILQDITDIPLSSQLEVVSHIKIIAGMDISEKRVPQDGHIALPHGGKTYDLRISSLPSVKGEKIVIRILDKNVSRWSLDSVVSSPDDARKFRELISNPYGILLITGPTGSGKTTTLYSVLQTLNSSEKNIVTIEDPVEYCLDGITQVQVKPAAGMNFAPALRSILRQDPDIILVGEIRDGETAEIAVSAAMTGHLVLSTLHTNDAAGAISRMVNLGVPPFLISSVLLGTVAQRLVRTICSHCKQAYKPIDEELKCLFGDSYRNKKDIQLYRGAKCVHCNNTGYHGRKGVFEILQGSSIIKEMIAGGQSTGSIEQQAIKEGMRTLRQSAVNEILSGTTTVEEFLRVIDVRTD